MLKIGIIGLGDIAKKAYLPVYAATENVEFHLYTRNLQKATTIAAKYRFNHVHEDLTSLINSGITAAFVHSATSSHESIVRLLLEKGIHVFVDKPITDQYHSAKALTELAQQKQVLLVTGFNRRYAPVNLTLKDVSSPNMVTVQKNRASLPEEIRTFVFDDFIHVVDTMRFLFPYPVEELLVRGVKKDGLLSLVVIQFISKQGIAVGMMNRESGTVEEKAEVMSLVEKRTAYNLAGIVVSNDSSESNHKRSDWESTLHKRGFESMVADFIAAVRTNGTTKISAEDALETHRYCEEITRYLEENL